jgi:hypothetical protein
LSNQSSSGNALDEWKEARGVLARFDGNLNDLRKYGFTFLAALLAADSVQALLKIEENTRFALIVITIAFIVSLRLLDHNYQQFEYATSIRARILETILNIELTETISERYRRDRLNWYVLSVYVAFVIMAGGLGVSILSAGYQVWVIVAVAVGIGLISTLSLTLKVNLLTHGMDLPEEDWIIDRVSCEQGEKVRITVTSLGENSVNFKSGHVVFEIRGEEGDLVDTVEANSDVSIPSYGNHSWLWDTKKTEPDKIYRVWPRGWTVPMKRSILVKRKSHSET